MLSCRSSDCLERQTLRRKITHKGLRLCAAIHAHPCRQHLPSRFAGGWCQCRKWLKKECRRKASGELLFFQAGRVRGKFDAKVYPNVSLCVQFDGTFIFSSNRPPLHAELETSLQSVTVKVKKPSKDHSSQRVSRVWALAFKDLRIWVFFETHEKIPK